MKRTQQLGLQSDQIEMVLAHHKAPARVTGGVVTPRAIQFHLVPDPNTRVGKVQALAEELALALGAPSVRVSRQGGNICVEIPRDDPGMVKLLHLIKYLASLDRSPGHSYLQPYTAVLGLCEDGAPLALRLPSPEVAHVLIAGTTGSGKTALCQSMLLSLALSHRPSQLQLVLVDPKRRAFAPLAHLPHLLWPVIDQASEAMDALGELVGLMEMRDRAAAVKGEAACTPRIVVVLDELADLLAQAKGLSEPLTRLAQRGREAGIHVIACTQKPSSQVLGSLLRANFPVRLVGKVVTAEDARVAAGVGGSGAEKLAGRGDFIAIAGGPRGAIRFQAAYVTAAEMSQVTSRLVNGRIPAEGRSLLEQAAAAV